MVSNQVSHGIIFKFAGHAEITWAEIIITWYDVISILNPFFPLDSFGYLGSIVMNVYSLISIKRGKRILNCRLRYNAKLQHYTLYNTSGFPA